MGCRELAATAAASELFQSLMGLGGRGGDASCVGDFVVFH